MPRIIHDVLVPLNQMHHIIHGVLVPLNQIHQDVLVQTPLNDHARDLLNQMHQDVLDLQNQISHAIHIVLVLLSQLHLINHDAQVQSVHVLALFGPMHQNDLDLVLLNPMLRIIQFVLLQLNLMLQGDHVLDLPNQIDLDDHAPVLQNQTLHNVRVAPNQLLDVHGLGP